MGVNASKRGSKVKQKVKRAVEMAEGSRKRSGSQLEKSPTITDMPELVLLHVASHLPAEDTIRLARTCRLMYSILPRFTLIKGEDFDIRGPYGGHWAPEKYFDSPKLTRPVKKLSISVTWKDQGWGNRKGELFMQLVRRGEVIAEKRRIFGIAEHEFTNPKAVISNDDVVSKSAPGDVFRFMRNAGGGGGHSLEVTNFRVLCEYMPGDRSPFE